MSKSNAEAILRNSECVAIKFVECSTVEEAGVFPMVKLAVDIELISRGRIHYIDKESLIRRIEQDVLETTWLIGAEPIEKTKEVAR